MSLLSFLPVLHQKMIDWTQYIEAYGFLIVSWIFLVSCLAIPEYSVLSAILQAIFVMFYLYLSHVIVHALSNIYPLQYLNPHVNLHHNHWLNLPRWLNLLIEAFTNFGLFLFLIVIQYVTGLDVLSNTLIIGAAFTYILVHIVKYSIIGNEQHKEHHENSFCNYAPEMLDTLFGTRCSPDAPYQSLSGEVPYIILGCGLAFGLKHLFPSAPDPLIADFPTADPPL